MKDNETKVKDHSDSTNSPQLLRNDKLDIAVGKHRHDKSWKNKRVLWSKLLEKLGTTHRTHESYDEYLAAKPDRQAQIKDVGGFVGGYMVGGRRKAGSVQHRQVLTLDADHATATLWVKYTTLFENAACVYSTHKHSAKAPRLRLVLPLDRPVTPDEYEPICRRIAYQLGIDQFDPTGYQVIRLMYWPSTSHDGEFFFDYQDGPWLNPDQVLAEYHDWRDTSEWPISDKENEIVHRNIKKQGDPLEKPGIVGAFCRTYDIHQAIEKYLPDVYTHTDDPNRYTYVQGSTAAGLVVYDDIFAYSHHSTDPTGGKLCNAFDLVRLHLFGLKDEDVKADTPVNKLPSFEAIADLASKDPEVKKLIIGERLQQAQDDFADVAGVTEDETEQEFELEISAEPPSDNSWMERLEVAPKTNKITISIRNLGLIILNHPVLKCRIKFDEFRKALVWIKAPVWREISKFTDEINDSDRDHIAELLEDFCQASIPDGKLKQALNIVAEKTKFHPVRSRLDGLKWDGKARIETLFMDYFGAENTELVRAITRKTLTAAVARIYEPGCKFDYILTLVGEQGVGKSTFIRKLAEPWFSDSFNFHMIRDKTGYEALRGVWIIEIGELSGMAKAEIEGIKSFVSAQYDRYRSAYGTKPETWPRQCIFIGSTNKIDFLRDQTGNRRFWPIPVRKSKSKSPSDLTPDIVGQIWAEAKHYYEKGEKLFLSAELETTARRVQQSHTEEHPWFSIIENYLEIKVPENWSKMTLFERRAWLYEDDEFKPEGVKERDSVCISQIWDEALQLKTPIDERSAATIRTIMRKMEGWEETIGQKRFGIYGRQRRWYSRVTKVPKVGTVDNLSITETGTVI